MRLPFLFPVAGAPGMRKAAEVAGPHNSCFKKRNALSTSRNRELMMVMLCIWELRDLRVRD